jgi:hypothetical protein
VFRVGFRIVIWPSTSECQRRVDSARHGAAPERPLTARQLPDGAFLMSQRLRHLIADRAAACGRHADLAHWRKW